MAKTNKLATLYRPDTMDRFTEDLMQEPLTEPTFQQDLESAGKDFRLDDLLETVHQTLKGKQVVETLLYRKSLRDLCIDSDDSINVLRTQDTQYTSSLVSGFNLLFNLSLSELFYRVREFPADISDKCREECKSVVRESVQYLQGKITFNEERKQFENSSGERIVRKKSRPFKEIYDEMHLLVEPSQYTRQERSLVALFSAFAQEYKGFKDDIALLDACSVAPSDPRNMDSALGRLMGFKEHLSDIKPNRLSLRYFLVRDILSSYGDTKTGYEILKRLTGQDIGMQAPKWIKKIKPTLSERLKFDYIDIKYGKFGNAITNFAVFNSLIGVIAVGLIQSAELYNPSVRLVVDSVPGLRDAYWFLTRPEYGVASTALLLGVLDKIPARILRNEYEKIQKVVHS